VEAFPSLFAGTLATAEVAEDHDVLPESEYLPMPEGELPPALEKDGEPDWKKFWAKVKSELGLTTEQARELLHVDSIKKDLIDQGVTMEKIWDSLVNALQGQKDREQVIDVQTGEVITQDEDLFGEREEEASAPAEAEPPKLEREPSPLKTINDLLKACNREWGMQPKEIYAELNVKSASEIKELPSECYSRISAVRK